MKHFRKILFCILSFAPFVLSIVFAFFLNFHTDKHKDFDFQFDFIFYSIAICIMCVVQIWIPLFIYLVSKDFISVRAGFGNLTALVFGFAAMFFCLKHNKDFKAETQTKLSFDYAAKFSYTHFVTGAPDKKIFHLNYTSVGLGSNFTSMQPVFNVNGNKFIYTSEQTSFFKGSPIQPADTILKGNFRTSSIDSIINLIRDIKDSLIYITNPDIMSGGIQDIIISKDKINLEFELFNASDPTAQKIVDILNTYIPNEERKLYLMDASDFEKKISH